MNFFSFRDIETQDDFCLPALVSCKSEIPALAKQGEALAIRRSRLESGILYLRNPDVN